MDITEYKIEKILFIKGVFIKDCVKNIDRMFEERLMENIDKPTVTIYKNIPSSFTSIESWINNTNIKCWYCDLNFESKPVFIPNILETSNEGIGYSVSVFGCFCSFCCAYSYNNLHNTKIYNNIQSKNLLIFLYKLFYNVNITELYEAPSKYTMLQYGGFVDTTSYKNNIKLIEKKIYDSSK